jgi:glucose-6-phosphate dehydrogenase assembly protein OpcA
MNLIPAGRGFSSDLMPGVWSSEDTTPSAIDSALRTLLEQRHAEDHAYAPARVLNLVVVVDREWKGEISNRLERVGRYHPSRTILCAVDPGREKLSAWAMISADTEPAPGEVVVAHEQVEIELGEKHLTRLDSIVDPLIVPDLSMLVWSPHGHPEAVDALLGLADAVLLDSAEMPDVRGALARSEDLARNAYVVDLSWLRGTPWRERLAASFDPPRWRPGLKEISSLTVRHEPDSGVAGLLLLGWLAVRLGWDPGALVSRAGSTGLVTLEGRARAGRKAEVKLVLEPDPTMPTPGLAGLTLETTSGLSLELNRGSGGLTASRRDSKGGEWTWTVLGASRGESGILGEGIRQGLLRDPTYRPALAAAAAMVS